MSLSTHDRIDTRPTSPPPAILSERITGWDEGGDRLLVTPNEPCPTLESFVKQIAELRIMPPSWDSYGARSHKSAVNAVRVFCQIMYDETPAPQVVPTNSGNIQLEWHMYGIDLEIEVSGEGAVNCWFVDSG